MTEPDDGLGTREEAIFAEVVDLPAEARAGPLERACGGDQALRARVEALLAAIGNAGDLLESPPPGAAEIIASNAGNGATLHEKPGDRIGGYRLVEEIGSGGCGVVYLAEQQEPVRRQVAFKVIKLGMDTRQVVARFEFERQVLAVMSHPNIAHVFEAGATDSGRPYFVMELVRGARITQFCDQEKLSTHERLELFLQACFAIEHAHQKGVIHRDIKPSNILVGRANGAPALKVIDFGIAKATDGQPRSGNTMFTAASQFVGTPAYMSPEQAGLGGVDVDTRSDIYSLGVLLYEILTGTTPLVSEQLLRLGMEDLCRTVREQEPPTPSRRLTTLGMERLAEVAGRHNAEGPRLLQALRGDLDWIVMKALEKDRTRRYESVGALAEDIRRYLSNRPVLARPPSAPYLFQKLVRRHRLAFTAGAVVATSLILGLAVSTRLYFEEQTARLIAEHAGQRAKQAQRAAETQRDIARRAEAEAQASKQRADQEAETATAVSQFLQTDILRQAGSWEQVSAGNQPDVNLSIRTAVERAAGKVGERFASRPIAEAGVRHAIGEAFRGMGEDNKSIEHLERALSLRKTYLGAEDSNTLESMLRLATACRMVRQYDRSLALSEELVRIQRARLGPDHPGTHQAMGELASIYSDMGKSREAIPILEKIFKAEMAGKEPGAPAPVSWMYNLGMSYLRAGQPDKSIEIHRKAFDAAKSQMGMAHPITVLLGRSVGQYHVDHGEYDKGLAILQQALDQDLINQGEAFPSSLNFMAHVALAYEKAERIDRALALRTEVFHRRRASLGAAHPDTYWALRALADAYERAGWQAALEKFLLKTLAELEAEGSAPYLSVTCMEQLEKACLLQGKADQAADWRSKRIALKTSLDARKAGRN